MTSYRILWLVPLLILGVLLSTGIILAQEDTVTFPVAELGGCESKETCKAYCEIEANLNACLTFAEAHGLMSKEDVEIARKVGFEEGPGGCRGEECRTYCETEGHTQECLAFAEEHDLLSEKELERAKKLAG